MMTQVARTAGWWVVACLALGALACRGGPAEEPVPAAPAPGEAPAAGAPATAAPATGAPAAPATADPTLAAAAPTEPAPAPAAAAPDAAAEAEPPAVPDGPGTPVSPEQVGADEPEMVVLKAIQAAMNPSEEEGWAQFQALLHTNQKLANSLTSWRTLNFAAFRRKVPLYLEDDTKPDFKVVRKDPMGEDGVTLYIHNERSMPTPCKLVRDPDQGNAWRIERCSL